MKDPRLTPLNPLNNHQPEILTKQSVFRVLVYRPFIIQKKVSHEYDYRIRALFIITSQLLIIIKQILVIILETQSLIYNLSSWHTSTLFRDCRFGTRLGIHLIFGFRIRIMHSRRL